MQDENVAHRTRAQNYKHMDCKTECSSNNCSSCLQGLQGSWTVTIRHSTGPCKILSFYACDSSCNWTPQFNSPRIFVSSQLIPVALAFSSFILTSLDISDQHLQEKTENLFCVSWLVSVLHESLWWPLNLILGAVKGDTNPMIICSFKIIDILLNNTPPPLPLPFSGWEKS